MGLSARWGRPDFFSALILACFFSSLLGILVANSEPQPNRLGPPSPSFFLPDSHQVLGAPFYFPLCSFSKRPVWVPRPANFFTRLLNDLGMVLGPFSPDHHVYIKKWHLYVFLPGRSFEAYRRSDTAFGPPFLFFF